MANIAVADRSRNQYEINEQRTCLSGISPNAAPLADKTPDDFSISGARRLGVTLF